VSVTLAVVVCSRDRPGQLRECLVALQAQAADDVLVVDSGSRTAATAEVSRQAGVRCVRADVPGLALARNIGLGTTDTDAVAFTDDDCRAAPGWAAAIRTTFSRSAEGEGEEQLGFVVGRVDASGKGPATSVLADTAPRVFGRADDPSHIGHGANLAVSRACWEAIGGFDDLLGAGSRLRSGEDSDFLWRALHRGWAGRYEPLAVVTHDQWRDRRAALQTSYGYGIGAGAVRTKVVRLAGPSGSPGFVAGSVRATMRQAGVDLRAGYRFGAAICLARSAGLVVGRGRASRLPLLDGHLTQR
jgi:glycosyltransferase involved in cell wall biosynthesis